MDPAEIEFTSLVGWLRTFPLQAEVSTAHDLSSGLALAETLVQIEPKVFAPSWYAGLYTGQQAGQTNNETLNRVLNLLLHYYRHSLGEGAVGELPLPDIPPGCQDLSPDTVATFLKLVLGVAVTCTNKQTFIAKIMSLDETTQHALTACIASFVYTKDWAGVVTQDNISPSPTTTSGISGVSGISHHNGKGAPSPLGDEIWAQKCHELDFQVAMLKEERVNLMTENEDLYGKVRAAQTLSRKDSVKTKEFERELAHIKDEFERLRLAYEGTKGQLEAMEVRLRSPTTGQDDLVRLREESVVVRSEMNKLKEVMSHLEVGERGDTGLGEVVRRVEEQGMALADVRTTLEYQAGLVQEVACLKDQLDVLREASHRNERYEVELTDIRRRMEEMNYNNMADIRENSNRTLMSLESETCLSSDSLDNPETMVDDEDRLDYNDDNGNVDTSAQSLVRSLEETLVVVDTKTVTAIEIESDDNEDMRSDSGLCDVAHEDVPGPVVDVEIVECRMVGSETPGLASRPESELILCDGAEDVVEEEATPRQLEQLLEEAGSDQGVEEDNDDSEEVLDGSQRLLRTIKDPNLDISLESIEATFEDNKTGDSGAIAEAAGRGEEEQEGKTVKRTSPEFAKAATLIDKNPESVFDPNDPSVAALEEWEHSPDKSTVLDDDYASGSTIRIRDRLKFKKSKTEERGKLIEQNGDDEPDNEGKFSLGCVNSWLLSIFVKIFD